MSRLVMCIAESANISLHMTAKKQEHLIYNGMSSTAALQLIYLYSLIFVGMIVGGGSYAWGL